MTAESRVLRYRASIKAPETADPAGLEVKSASTAQSSTPRKLLDGRSRSLNRDPELGDAPCGRQRGFCLCNTLADSGKPNPELVKNLVDLRPGSIIVGTHSAPWFQSRGGVWQLCCATVFWNTLNHNYPIERLTILQEALLGHF